jgi:hypothetical protein
MEWRSSWRVAVYLGPLVDVSREHRWMDDDVDTKRGHVVMSVSVSGC